jgi:LysR family transcriptional regulator (chromosome initiation inhibitor)
VKNLEDRLGAVLIVRGQPCTATATGMRLCRHADEVGLLEHRLLEDIEEIKPDTRPLTIRIAVNADSLATWFVVAMAATRGVLFDLVLDDQDHSAEWLRRGEVSAAVTATLAAPQGCASLPLGALRYVATASQDFCSRWFAAGVNEQTLARAPCLRFNAKDALQDRWMERVTGQPVAPPSHWLPASQAFVDAARAGLGWGMNPEILVCEDLASGKLQPLLPGRTLDVPLFWQWPRSLEAALADIAAAVAAAAKCRLVQ